MGAFSIQQDPMYILSKPDTAATDPESLGTDYVFGWVTHLRYLYFRSVRIEAKDFGERNILVVPAAVLG